MHRMNVSFMQKEIDVELDQVVQTILFHNTVGSMASSHTHYKREHDDEGANVKSKYNHF